MKILVCGGRNYGMNDDGTHNDDEIDLVFDVMEEIDPDEIVEGGARGADTFARTWGHANYKEVHTMRADWTKYGLGAGPRRNQQMLDEHKDISLVVAFPGGNGTADMVRRAKKAGIPVKEIVNTSMGEFFG